MSTNLLKTFKLFYLCYLFSDLLWKYLSATNRNVYASRLFSFVHGWSKNVKKKTTLRISKIVNNFSGNMISSGKCFFGQEFCRLKVSSLLKFGNFAPMNFWLIRLVREALGTSLHCATFEMSISVTCPSCHDYMCDQEY